MKYHDHKRLDRRSFIAAINASALVAAGTLREGGPLSGSATAAPPAATRRPAVAFLGTVVHTHSHAQHFLDRLTLGYTWNGGWQTPRVQIDRASDLSQRCDHLLFRAQ